MKMEEMLTGLLAETNTIQETMDSNQERKETNQDRMEAKIGLK
jgi:hypothetical protein